MEKENIKKEIEEIKKYNCNSKLMLIILILANLSIIIVNQYTTLIIIVLIIVLTIIIIITIELIKNKKELNYLLNKIGVEKE